MAIIRYEPLNMLSQFQNEINRLFDSRLNTKDDNSAVETGQWLPMVDIKEEPKQFALYADIPGVDPKNIEISMDHNVLTIKGTRQSETKSEEENFTRVERVFGSFHRRFTLPDTADSENISAKVKNGVLEIIIPKRETSKSKKINVKVAD